ncbi:FHA domain-containing protein [Desulfofundulus sp. TPOSR]|uniref:FHA domain-containing protein n=1 Tax=Desulfofundulus sp. TPOSR TaxID=2714340 RepID=UPI00140846DF|nr:FHA domain-containing protein [Desulfofundulus sp. TPOSR]NHM25631.1 FHA domain-containing protein [Desulfofundulus sp. TPOSR]
MLGLLLTLLRYLFLFLLYAFLFVVVRQMFFGLREYPAMATPAAAGRSPGNETKPLHGSREAAVPKPGGRLVVLASPDPRLEKGMTFYLGERITLGRGEHNGLVIPDPFSSQEHAVIFSRGDQYWVQDLGSLNGTYLNEMRLDRPTVLADGDRLRIGGVTFQFVRWAYEVESSQ